MLSNNCINTTMRTFEYLYQIYNLLVYITGLENISAVVTEMLRMMCTQEIITSMLHNENKTISTILDLLDDDDITNFIEDSCDEEEINFFIASLQSENNFNY